jgi:hypothetical protein
VSAQTANTAALAWGAARRGDGRNARAYARVTAAPPSALMKWANENAVQQPDLGHAGAGGHRAHGGEAVLRRQIVAQESDQVPHLVRKARDLVLGPRIRCGDASRRSGASAERERGAAVAARRAAQPEVDASRMERLQQPELLRHFQRAVVGEHHTARADADPARPIRDLGDQDLRRRPGQSRGRVMFGQPVAVIAEPVGSLGDVERLPDCLGGSPPLPNRRLVEDAQAEGSVLVGHSTSLPRRGWIVPLGWERARALKSPRARRGRR